MKTRVSRKWNNKHGIWMFLVWKWDLWDAPDLREHFPDAYAWRFVREYPEEEDARQCAIRVSQHGQDPKAMSPYVDYDGGELLEEFDGSIDPVQRTCKSCSYWIDARLDSFGQPMNERVYMKQCRNPKLAEPSEVSREQDALDLLIYSYDERGTFSTGPDFGCVHWRTR